MKKVISRTLMLAIIVLAVIFLLIFIPGWTIAVILFILGIFSFMSEEQTDEFFKKYLSWW